MAGGSHPWCLPHLLALSTQREQTLPHTHATTVFCLTVGPESTELRTADRKHRSRNTKEIILSGILSIATKAKHRAYATYLCLLPALREGTESSKIAQGVASISLCYVSLCPAPGPLLVPRHTGVFCHNLFSLERSGHFLQFSSLKSPTSRC